MVVRVTPGVLTHSASVSAVCGTAETPDLRGLPQPSPHGWTQSQSWEQSAHVICDTHFPCVISRFAYSFFASVPTSIKWV